MIYEIGVRDLKNKLTAIIRSVREDQAEYTVTLHGKPVAVIRPVAPRDAVDHAEAVQLELARIEAIAAQFAGVSGSTRPLRETLEDLREESEWP